MSEFDYSHLRNPWHGIDSWKEFKHDVRHPLNFVRGAIHNVNKVGRGQRKMGFGIMVVGLLQVLVGIAMLVRGYFF